MLLTKNKLLMILVLAAAAIAVYGYYSYERYNWVAVETDIDVTREGSYSIKFTSQLDGRYDLWLETERVLDFTEQSCRLGLAIYTDEQCDSWRNTLLITWSIQQGDMLLATGDSNDSESSLLGSTISKNLYGFKTEKGKEYVITTSVTDVDAGLMVTHPQVKVAVDMGIHKYTYVTSRLAFSIAIFLLMIAVCIALIQYFIRRSKNTMEHKY